MSNKLYDPLKTPFQNISWLSRNIQTRQLPVGVGHCPWAGYTDRNACNMDEEVHLASWLSSNTQTRQLPMGAGHCPWAGCTDRRNACNMTLFYKKLLIKPWDLPL